MIQFHRSIFFFNTMIYFIQKITSPVDCDIKNVIHFKRTYSFLNFYTTQFMINFIIYYDYYNLIVIQSY